MKLLTAELRNRLPALYNQEDRPDATVYAKFFTPDSSWTWFVTEGSPELDEAGAEVDYRFFGHVIGQESEWGYFVLSELESARGPMGLSIERDLYFETGPFSEVMARYHSERSVRRPRSA